MDVFTWVVIFTGFDGEMVFSSTVQETTKEKAVDAAQGHFKNVSELELEAVHGPFRSITGE